MIKQHYVNVTTKSSTKQISANEFVAINYYYYDGNKRQQQFSGLQCMLQLNSASLPARLVVPG